MSLGSQNNLVVQKLPWGKWIRIAPKVILTSAEFGIRFRFCNNFHTPCQMEKHAVLWLLKCPKKIWKCLQRMKTIMIRNIWLAHCQTERFKGLHFFFFAQTQLMCFVTLHILIWKSVITVWTPVCILGWTCGNICDNNIVRKYSKLCTCEQSTIYACTRVWTSHLWA